MMSADRIFFRICSFEGCCLMSRRMSVRHFRNLPKYSWTRFQYLSESELAVGIKSSFGFFFFESRIVSRSIEAVPLVLISPPPMATITFCICSSYFESNSGAPPGFRADHGQSIHNPVREELPTNRGLSRRLH